MAVSIIQKIKGSVSSTNASVGNASVNVAELDTAGKATGKNVTVNYSGLDVDLPKVGSIVEVVLNQVV